MTMTDADRRHLDRIIEDVVPLLGPGVTFLGLDVDGDPSRGADDATAGSSTILRATYRFGDVRGESIGRGATLMEAHAGLRAALVEDRLGLGLRALV